MLASSVTAAACLSAHFKAPLPTPLEPLSASTVCGISKSAGSSIYSSPAARHSSAAIKLMTLMCYVEPPPNSIPKGGLAPMSYLLPPTRYFPHVRGVILARPRWALVLQQRSGALDPMVARLTIGHHGWLVRTFAFRL